MRSPQSWNPGFPSAPTLINAEKHRKEMMEAGKGAREADKETEEKKEEKEEDEAARLQERRN